MRFFSVASIRTRWCIIFALVLNLLWITPAMAVEIPPTGSVAFIQTTGPNGALSNGDYYTNLAGAGINHLFIIFVPCGGPVGVPVTFALYDPEVALPNPVFPNPPALDEIRPNAMPVADNTTFTLVAPGGIVTGPITYTPTGGTNGLWVEVLTVDPNTLGYGCGQYALSVTTSDNDENAWRLRVSYDPDCTASVPTPGTCSGIGIAQSALLGNNNSQDDVDNIPGTGDELAIGVARTSYQHNAPACQDFYFFVDAVTPFAIVNNFDMDNNTSVTYFPPPTSQYFPSVNGVVSGDNRWNNGNPPPPSPPQRAGDVLPVTEQDAGFWRAELCANVENQYIFEGIEGKLVFFDPQPFPNMEVSKTDGVTFIESTGQIVTYVITYRNTGNGAATNVVIQDTVPPGSALNSCTGGCIPGNPVIWNLGTIPAGAVGNVTVTVTLPAVPENTLIRNVAQLSYSDVLGNNFPPRFGIDDNFGTGISQPPTPGPFTTPEPTGNPIGGFSSPGGSGGVVFGVAGFTQGLLPTPDVTRTPLVFRRSRYIAKGAFPGFALPGTSVQWVILITNPNAVPLTGIRVEDTLPPQMQVIAASATDGTLLVNGQQVTLTLPQLAPGTSATITIQTQFASSVVAPFFAENGVCMTSAELPNPECAEARIASVSNLPFTGASPWANWRIIVLILVMAIAMSIVILIRWWWQCCQKLHS
jgi:uncharacterized repeat protein (TIGR01451 family)